MRFHHRLVEPKDPAVRQVEATQEQTTAIHTLVDSVRDH